MSDAFQPETVSTEAEIAEAARTRDAEAVKTACEMTEAVLIRLESSWWGKEAFGQWGEFWLIQPEFVSDNGGLKVSKGVALSDVTGYVRSARSARETVGGLNSKAARKLERKVTDWFDTSEKPGPGMAPVDERDSFRDEWVPVSKIQVAVRTPPSEDNLLVGPDGAERGQMDDADIRVTDTARTKYGEKFVLEGDTYEVLSSKGEDLGDEMDWGTAHATYDGGVGEWVCDAESDALSHVIGVLTDEGYTVAVADTYEGAAPTPATA